MNILRNLNRFDVLGIEASLYSNKSSKRHQSVFGGLISVLIFMLITAACGFFVNEFFSRKNVNLISSFQTDYTLSYDDFSDTPFMIRLSGNFNLAYDSNYYIIKWTYCEYDETVSNQQRRELVTMEPCEINKHFSRNKELVENINDLNTYYCPIYPRKMPLYGVYGSTWFSYHHISFKPCLEGITGTDCPDYDAMITELKMSYIDFVTITNKIDHYSSIPNTPELYKGRIQVSSNLFKRIWLYWQGVNYFTDTGYIFPSEHHDRFFNFHNVEVDVDLDSKKNEFVWVSLLNNEYRSDFKRIYMKAQTLLANIGGIIKGLTIIGTILNYPISTNLFQVDLINSIYHGSNSFLVDKTNKSFIPNISDKLNTNNKMIINNLESHLNKSVAKNNIENTSSHLFNYTNKENSVLNRVVSDIKEATPKISYLNQIKSKFKSYKKRNNNHNLKTKDLNKLYPQQHTITESQVNNIKNSDSNIKPNPFNEINKENNDKILVNNYTTEDLKLVAFRKKAQIKSLNRSIDNAYFNVTRKLFTLSKCALLDPFQWFMKTNRKKEHDLRLEKANKLLNVSNLISILQEFNLFKKVFLEQSQISLLEHINNKNPNMEELNIAYNQIILKSHNSKTAKKLLDNLEI